MSYYIMQKRRTQKFVYTSLMASLLFSFSARSELYSGIQFSYTDIEVWQTNSNSWKDASPYLMQAQIGYFFSDYLATEVRYGTSIKRSSDIAVDYLASVFVKGNVSVTERVAMYALVGYSDIKINSSRQQDQSDQDMSFGAGVHYAFDRNKAATLEFINYTDGDTVRANGLQVGFQFRF